MGRSRYLAGMGGVGVACVILLGACGDESEPDVATAVTSAIQPLDVEETHPSRTNASWPQWGQNARHSGFLNVAGQNLSRNLASVIYDPLVPEETANFGVLLVHYQAPLVDDDDVFMMFKKGPFDLTNYSTQTWGESRFTWRHGKLERRWDQTTDWKAPGGIGCLVFEPVFHPALANGSIYLPGAGGTVLRLEKTSGRVKARINPFDGVDSNTVTVSPLTADAQGNIYYNVVRKDGNDFCESDPVDSWLVKVTPDDTPSKVSYSVLTPDAPRADDLCSTEFAVGDPDAPLPWPPSRDAVPARTRCSLQRVAVNLAPAVAQDGTIYSVTHPHTMGRHGFLVAVSPDLKPKWTASLDERLHDGCGVSVGEGGWLPPNGAPGGCRQGARRGVDPTTNRPGSGIVDDASSATPTVAPDGTILIGLAGRYNYGQGHLMQFSASGRFLRAYGFGWDSTPAIWEHGSTYSIVLKENHYFISSYCLGDDNFCPLDRSVTNPASPEAYLITQLNPRLEVEWQFQATNQQSCSRDATGAVTCLDDGFHPNGFEWCVNAPAVDRYGVVYANSEDGYLYAIEQGGKVKQSIFQQLNLGAAYTPASLGGDGKVYSQNAGRLFVVGD